MNCKLLLLAVALPAVALADSKAEADRPHHRPAHPAPYHPEPYQPDPYGPYAPSPYSYAPRPYEPTYAPKHPAPYAPKHPAPYAPTYAPKHPAPYAPEPSYGYKEEYPKESAVHRNPYESHDEYDAIRTQDKDLAPYNPYNNPYSAHGHGGYSPYKYDMSKVPECAYTNKHYYNLTFCLQDDYYPTETIQYELKRNRALVDRLLSDITYQSADNLVDGLTKAEEEGYTYEHYYGQEKYQQYGNDYDGYKYQQDYYKDGGYVCPSDIFYGRPKRAVNTYNKWKVIVNLPDEYYAKGYGKGYEKYTQTQRLEQCMYPEAPCSYIDEKVYSSCLQKHNFVRLLAYTYEEGLHIDSFKLPIACSCHIEKPAYGYGYAPKAPSYGYAPNPYHRG